jgi:hypothetical protein
MLTIRWGCTSGVEGDVKPEANGEATGKKKKKKADDMDIDALLAEIDGPKPPPPEPTGSTAHSEICAAVEGPKRTSWLLLGPLQPTTLS